MHRPPSTLKTIMSIQKKGEAKKMYARKVIAENNWQLGKNAKSWYRYS